MKAQTSQLTIDLKTVQHTNEKIQAAWMDEKKRNEEKDKEIADLKRQVSLFDYFESYILQK